MWQERNKHDLMNDFEDEISGYLHNEKIRHELEDLPVRHGIEQIPNDNLHICYEKLTEMGIVNKQEIHLLGRWIKDFESIN